MVFVDNIMVTKNNNNGVVVVDDDDDAAAANDNDDDDGADVDDKGYDDTPCAGACSRCWTASCCSANARATSRWRSA